MKLVVGAAGSADPGVAWDRYLRPDRWSEWSPQISSVAYPDVEIADGGQGTVQGPCGIGLDFEILNVDVENRCWSWRVRPVGIELIMKHAVFAEGSGCRSTLEINGPLPVIAGYAPIARIALGRLVRG
jgi:hypothetical protein